MKGFGPTVTLIIVIVTLVFIAGFLIYAYLGPPAEATKQSTRLTAEQIAGMINMLQTSPSIAKHTLELPDKCIINIDGSVVKVTMERKSSISGIIRTDITVKPSEINCAKTGKAYFVRCPDYVEISGAPKDCET